MKMKVVILAGGIGSRISEETHLRPKPMINIGGMPVLWHIMKSYSYHGLTEFIICCGYKGHMIKEYFANYFLHMSDITIDLSNNQMEVHHRKAEPWKITLVDTGLETMTGGRLRRICTYLSKTDPFCMTYGDGVSDIDIGQLIKFHYEHGLEATITAAYPPGRFGALSIQENSLVTSFLEKPKGEGGMINAGFFVLSPRVIDLIPDDSTLFEREPLEILAKNRQLAAFRHTGFWQPMDTLRDKNHLEELWNKGQAPWKVWQ